ncbi:RICIN domain-containing protein [Salinibacterium hongtaonis]|uniref:Ricin B lectin domain-containing protein n=1 Tax=Homoserinimonas hongtaonis TaxID=2079791 RepID=A0A2U1SZI1_9MICO|nr:RICIN domain-containing protein [Salinibacterium hongtaonis]PWB97031.1 hypothetical protein DF220_03650 [Salinibacterium hongtaonis]
MRIPAFLRRSTARRNPLRGTLIHSGGILALVVLLVASGAGVTYALWNASATATSTAKGAQLAVTAVFGGTFANFSFQNHAATANGTVTVTNTTATTRTTAMPVSTQLSAAFAGVDATWASKFTVWVWPQSAAACTATALPASGVQGTWATIPAISTTLAPAASVVYCVRSVAAERSQLGVASGTFTITPQATATLSFSGSSAWTAAAAPTTTQTTRSIYPVGTVSTTNWYRISDAAGANCVDVESSTDTNGRPVIGFACKPNSEAGKTNQRWKLTADGTYYRISTQLSSGRSVVVTAGSDASGAAVSINSTAADEGRWQLQQVTAGVYQLVNKKSGMCLTRGAVTGSGTSAITALSQTACSASAAQRFTFTADGSTIVTGPVFVPAPTTVPNPNARYTIKTSGSASCVARSGNSANLTTSACSDQTEWRFKPAASGAAGFYITMATQWGNSAGLAMYADGTGNGADVDLGTLSTNDTRYRWTVVAQSDGSYQLRNVANARCLNSSLNLTTCSANPLHKVQLEMIGNPNPPAADLTCTQGQWTATYSWPVPTNYQSEVLYRAYVGKTLMTSTIDGWQTFQLSSGNTAAFAEGQSYAVTVEQTVKGTNTWTTVGTSIFTKVATDGSTSPFLCGAP